MSTAQKENKVIPPTRVQLAILTGSLLAICFPGCTKKSVDSTNHEAAPGNATAHSVPATRLDAFVGQWGGHAGRSSAVSGKIGLDSRFMKTTVKKISAEAILLEGDIWSAKGTLRFDNDTQKYLLSFTAEDFPGVTNIPLSFSDSDGFSGESTFKNAGKEYKATATIKDDKGVSDWQIKVTQGKDFWSLTVRLGKG